MSNSNNTSMILSNIKAILSRANAAIPEVAVGFMAVTLDADLPTPARVIMVATDGNVAVNFVDGSTGVLPALKAGIMYTVAIERVLTTGTTATGVIALK